VLTGYLLNCEIPRFAKFDRKNYCYPDSAKNYQVTQYDKPSTANGWIEFEFDGPGSVDGLARVRITRAHLEEDVGKNNHFDRHSGVDFNRAGVPLLEIVSEPDLKGPDMAYAYLKALTDILARANISDCDLEKGMVRCDVNVSVRPRGSEKLGAKIEIKNMNSFSGVRRALEYEIPRQIEAVKRGEALRQETRRWDDVAGITEPMRSKEDAHDYRYFPEPDLPPFHFTEDWLDRLMSSLPALPEVMTTRFRNEYGLSEYDARQLCEEKELCDYFLDHLPAVDQAKPFANWLLGPVRSLINEQGGAWALLNISRDAWADLLSVVSSGRISFSSASQQLFPRMMSDVRRMPSEIAAAEGLLQDAGGEEIEGWVDQVLGSMPDKVAEYRKGKKGLIGLFMGEVKKLSRGKADPRSTQEILQQKLNASS